MREFTLTDPSGNHLRIGAGRADQRRRVKLAIPEPGPAGLRPPAIQTGLLLVIGVDEDQTLGAVAPRTPGVPRVDCHSTCHSIHLALGRAEHGPAGSAAGSAGAFANPFAADGARFPTPHLTCSFVRAWGR